MKIHLINPNTSQHMTEQMQESAQAVANASTEIVGRTPRHGAVSIESHFDEAMSIKEAVHNGDVAKAAEVLKEVLRNKPEKNKWSDDDQNETSNRAFYETGG